MKTVIVIDFDNTIGYFKQIVYLLNIIELAQKRSFNQNDVDNLINLYPNVLRPRINEILTMIHQMKTQKKINYFILYTTNRNEKFVNMVVDFIERISGQEKKYLFDLKVFSLTKDKPINNLLQENIVKSNIPVTLCFVDNKRLIFTEECDGITSVFIKCDTYKYLYDIRHIIKLFDYSIYNNLNKKIITKYFAHIYKRSVFTNLPYQINEMNSIYLINSINDFCDS